MGDHRRRRRHGGRDVFDGGQVRLLPAEPAVVQAGDGRPDGAASAEPVPAPGERGGAAAADAAGDGDCGGVRAAPHGHLHPPLLPRQRRRSGPDVRALHRIEHPPARQSHGV